MMTHTLAGEQTRLVPGSNSTSRSRERRISKRSKIIVSTVVFIGLLLVLVQLAFPSSFVLRSSSHKKKNVIFFVTDGMGPASLSMARSFNQHIHDLQINDILTLDQHFIGSSRTRSSDSLVTDSAAGATAFACALKSYNGAIGVDPDHKPCGTVLEAAKLAGYLTGLVVTTRITDATPASFSSHVDYRWQEDLIATHQLGGYPLGRVVDLLMGGGRSHFYPVSYTHLDVYKRQIKILWCYHSCFFGVFLVILLMIIVPVLIINLFFIRYERYVILPTFINFSFNDIID